jgi:hypothetical protein
MGEERGVHRLFVGKPEGKNHWEDPDVDGRIKIKLKNKKLYIVQEFLKWV